eukprot:SAG11_NODE_208_length_12354_cov_19.490167_9_plen_116_part_00
MDAVEEERAEGHGLGGCKVDALAGLDGLGTLLHDARQRPMKCEALRHLGHPTRQPDLGQRLDSDPLQRFTASVGANNPPRPLKAPDPAAGGGGRRRRAAAAGGPLWSGLRSGSAS